MNCLNYQLTRRFAAMTAVAALAPMIGPPVLAQDYPTREIHAVCAYPAGSGADVMVRFYSDRLSKLAGKPVIVDNRAGAQGLIGTQYVARADPNGYTILIGSPSASFAAAPHLYKSLPYDPIKDFAPVAPITWLPFVIAVDAKSPIRSIGDLVAHLKQKGSKSSYATGTVTGEVAAAVFNQMAGLKAVNVAYKGAAQAMGDMGNGQIDFIVWDATFLSAQAKGGRARLVAVTSARRSSALPDVPTMIESGFADFDISAWWGVLVPAGTPKAVVDRLAGWIAQINAAEDTRKYLGNVATDVLNGTPEWMQAQIVKDSERWARYVKLARIEPQ
jgi:tripartite-type tricarboxylate transporter receptor subunit TctC